MLAACAADAYCLNAFAFAGGLIGIAGNVLKQNAISPPPKDASMAPEEEQGRGKGNQCIMTTPCVMRQCAAGDTVHETMHDMVSVSWSCYVSFRWHVQLLSCGCCLAACKAQGNGVMMLCCLLLNCQLAKRIKLKDA